ncbi:DUF6933 domain-containing protein [Chitinophaga qingshengii]|uniref:DUF6933 domain-containing protein n=1 Tax=Chitinophaga qingshengii TaxID=1569794 RepID=A0ABR7TLU8_9BACT|nr:hypothetical protein [Chitinophaga qingshengii]MBC9930039.1 hypothetical protein [Chitinophaga qingshengii]
MPVIFHAVQKLLNTSRLKTVQYVSKGAEGQLLHSWYATLLNTGFSGKLLVMYVHEPSLLTVVCRGKTIGGTWEEFLGRLPALLKKAGFPEKQIEWEISLMDSYVVAKTSSRSMRSYMTQMMLVFEGPYASYEGILLERLEENILDYPYSTPGKAKRYNTAGDYWREYWSAQHL